MMWDKLRDRLLAYIKWAKTKRVRAQPLARPWLVSKILSNGRRVSGRESSVDSTDLRFCFSFFSSAWYVRFYAFSPSLRWSPSPILCFPPSSEEIARGDSAKFVPKWWCHYGITAAWLYTWQQELYVNLQLLARTCRRQHKERPPLLCSARGIPGSGLLLSFSSSFTPSASRPSIPAQEI